MRPGSAWIDMSTSNAATARRVIDAAGSTRFAMLDAPVTGGVSGAQEGTLQIFVGGEKEVFERHLPVLKAVGDPDRIFHVGGQGAGYTVKLCVNLLFFIHVAAGAEVLTLGTKAGVDLDVLHRLFVGSGASSRFLERDAPRVFEGDYLEYFRPRTGLQGPWSGGGARSRKWRSPGSLRPRGADPPPGVGPVW